MNIQLLNYSIPSYYKGLCFFIISAGVFFLPVKTKLVITKSISQGLSIQTAKRDPPRIAFNELSNQKNNTHWPPRVPSINLNKRIEDSFSKATLEFINSKKISLKPIVISRQLAIAEIEKELSNKAWIENLPAQQKIRITEAQNKSNTLDQDWSLPTWETLLHQEFEKAGVTAKTQNQINKNKSINGIVQFKEGVGLGDGHIEIELRQQGASQSIGTLDQKSGNFTIPVNDYSGILYGRLYDKSGNKRGEGELKITDKNSKEKAVLYIGPTQNMVAANFNSFDRAATKAGEKETRGTAYNDGGIPAKTYYASLDTEITSDYTGTSKIENVSKKSWVIARTHANGYYPALNLLAAGQENSKQLFRENFVNSLLEITRDIKTQSTVQENGSVIWGQVKMGGKAQAGVRIETEYSESHQTIYFNALLIPDPTLKETSENGYFAILHLPEGFHTLLAYRGENFFGHLNIQTEPGALSQAEIEATLKIEKASLKVYDAFSGQGVDGKIEMQSLRDPIDVSNMSEIYLPQINRLSLLKVTPKEEHYYTSLHIYSENDSELDAPLISKEWVNRIKQSKKINQLPDTTIVVGFVREEEFDVYLPHIENYSSENIVYFNAHGDTVESGVPGGGYILFNVITGTHSVTIVSKETNEATAFVIPVELETINVLN